MILFLNYLTLSVLDCIVFWKCVLYLCGEIGRKQGMSGEMVVCSVVGLCYTDLYSNKYIQNCTL